MKARTSSNFEMYLSSKSNSYGKDRFSRLPPTKVKKALDTLSQWYGILHG